MYIKQALEDLRKLSFSFFSRVNHKLYPQMISPLITGEIYLPKETVKIALMYSSFEFDASQNYFMPEHECDHPDYIKGGEILPIRPYEIEMPLRIYPAVKHTIFTTHGVIGAQGAVIYIENKKNPTAQIALSYMDFGHFELSFGGSFILEWGNYYLYKLSC